jgi:hypothetical protein
VLLRHWGAQKSCPSAMNGIVTYGHMWSRARQVLGSLDLYCIQLVMRSSELSEWEQIDKDVRYPAGSSTTWRVMHTYSEEDRRRWRLERSAD